MAIRYNNLSKEKQQKGYYIDITLPYSEILELTTKIVPDIESKKYMIDGEPNHSFLEWVKHYLDIGHTLIDVSPEEKPNTDELLKGVILPNITVLGEAPSLNILDLQYRLKLLESAKLALDFKNDDNKDITNPSYSLHFGIGETFYDPKKGTYTSMEQKLRWDEAERKNREFNKQVDNIIGGTSVGLVASALAAGTAPYLLTYLAPGTIGGNLIGDLAGGIAGYEAVNLGLKAKTGKTWEENVNNKLGIDDNSFVGSYITPLTNPGGYASLLARPFIPVASTLINDFSNSLAKQYINKTNPSLILKTKNAASRVFMNAGNTISENYYKFLAEHPRIKMIVENPKIFIGGKSRNSRKILDTRRKIGLLEDERRSKKYEFREQEEDLSNKLSTEKSKFSSYEDLDDTTEMLILSPRGTLHTESIVTNPFTGKDIPISLHQNLSFLVKRNEYDPIRIFSSYDKLNVSGEIAPGGMHPIVTDSDNLLSAVLEIKTELEQRIGGDGIVGGSVYKLSKGHFLGSDLNRNANSAPHDIEIYTYSNDVADKIGNKLGALHTGSSRMVRLYEDDLGNRYEIAVIEENPLTGKASGDLAWQFFETYNPDEALKLKRQYAEKGLSYIDLDIPMTPKELYNAYKQDPELLDLRTTIDTFTASGNISSFTGVDPKQKHYDRTAQMLMDSSSENISRVRKAIDTIYSLIWGVLNGTTKLPSKVYSSIDYNDIAANKTFLERIGFSKEVSEQMAKNPEQVKNVFDYWYLQKICSRINTGDDVVANSFSIGSTKKGFVGIAYNPLAHKPETIKSLKDVVTKYDSMYRPYDDIASYNLQPNESLNDYIERMVGLNEDKDATIVWSDYNFLRRLSPPNSSDVGLIQSDKNPIKIGQLFTLDPSILEESLPFDVILSHDEVLFHPEKYQPILRALEKNTTFYTMVKQKAEQTGKSYSEVAKELKGEIDKKVLSLEKLLADCKHLQSSVPNTISKNILKLQSEELGLKFELNRYKQLLNLITKAERLFASLGLGTGASLYLGNSSRDVQRTINYYKQYPPILALKSIKKDYEEALKKAKNSEDKKAIENFYKKIIEELSNEITINNNFIKIANSQPSHVTNTTQETTPKYEHGGYLNEKITNDKEPIMTDNWYVLQLSSAIIGNIKAVLGQQLALYNNPTAKRILGYDNRVYIGKPGELGEEGGEYGNVYLGSYGEYVTPLIQDTKEGLLFIPQTLLFDAEHLNNTLKQSFKMRTPEEALSFAENYKLVVNNPMLRGEYQNPQLIYFR